MARYGWTKILFRGNGFSRYKRPRLYQRSYVTRKYVVHQIKNGMHGRIKTTKKRIPY